MPDDARLVVFGLTEVLATSFAVTWIVLLLARWRRHYDVPNERSSHETPTPRSGGIGIVAGLFACCAIPAAVDPAPGASAPDAFGPLLAVLAACGVGLLDDLRPMRPSVKMALFLIPVLVLAGVQPVDVVHGVPFVGDVHLGRAAWPLTVFWLACYPQAFNFMDGLNGIAALTAIVSAEVIAVACGAGSVVAIAAAITATSTLGFLPWNFPKARIFMGDAGSLPLGLVLAGLAVAANKEGVLPFPASVLLLGPFIFDVAFTLVRRAMEGKTIGEAHREHLYQRLSRVWNSHAKVSLLYAGFSVVTGVLALSYASMSDLGRLLSLVLPLAAMLGFAAFVLRAEREKGR